MDRGLGERSGFRARAGTLTLLLAASLEEPADLCAMLARLDELLFDPDADPDLWEWERDEAEDPGDVAGPPRPDKQLSDSGLELISVGRVLERWLRESPAGPLRLGEEEAALALGALVVGWSSTAIHALSGAALTFEELVEATGAVNEGALADRMEALEDSCLVELLEGPGGEARYAATPWLRRAIAPLAAAARHERRHGNEDAAPPDMLDVGAAFLLTLPLLELPAELSGGCRMCVPIPAEGPAEVDEQPKVAGATARVERGRVVSVDLRLDLSLPTWAAGAPIEWLEAVVAGVETVKLGGDTRLAAALVGGLHEALFTSWS